MESEITKLFKHSLKIIKDINKETFQRNRKLSFKDILYSTIYMNLKDESYRSTIAHLLDKKIADVTVTALHKKRKDIDSKYFLQFNDRLLTYIYKDVKYRLIAVDSSQVNLLHKLINDGFKESANKTYTVGYLSCLYDIERKIPISYYLAKHRDEREMLRNQLSYVKKNDVLVMDRGYYSYDLAKLFEASGIKYIFRLQTGLKIVDALNESGKDDTTVMYKNIIIRVLKYTVSCGTYYIGTNILEKGIEYFKDTYWKRWSIETHFRYDKYYLNLSDIKSQSENKVKQDIYAHQSLFIFNSYISYTLEKHIDTTKYKINTKICMKILSTEIMYLLFYKKLTKQIIANLQKCQEIIKSAVVDVKKDRKCKRIKCKPATKWTHRGNKHEPD